MGTAIPMDAGGVDAHEDVGTLGQRGVGPGLGKGGGYRAPVAPTARKSRRQHVEEVGDLQSFDEQNFHEHHFMEFTELPNQAAVDLSIFA